MISLNAWCEQLRYFFNQNQKKKMLSIHMRYTIKSISKSTHESNKNDRSTTLILMPLEWIYK